MHTRQTHMPMIICVKCSPRPAHARNKARAHAQVRTPKPGTLVPRLGVHAPRLHVRLEKAYAPKADTHVHGPGMHMPRPWRVRPPADAAHALGELHALCSACRVYCNDPNDLLQPCTI